MSRGRLGLSLLGARGLCVLVLWLSVLLEDWVDGVSLRICPSSSTGRVMVGVEGLYLRHMAVCLTQEVLN